MGVPSDALGNQVVGIIGAGGVTGRALLANLPDGVRSRAVVRRTELESVVREAGATETAVGDYSAPDTLVNALRGVDAAYVIVPQFCEDEPAFVSNAVSAATAVGVRRFVYHSVLHPYTPAMRHHQRKAVAEIIVRESALSWTILQPAMYAETVRMMLLQSGDSDVVKVPYRLDAPFSPLALLDLAEAAARVLLQDGHEYGTYELAGPGRQSIDALVQTTATVMGRSVTARHVMPQDVSFPPSWGPSSRADAAAMWLYYDSHGLVGNPSILEWLLGRPATEFATAISRIVVR